MNEILKFCYTYGIKMEFDPIGRFTFRNNDQYFTYHIDEKYFKSNDETKEILYNLNNHFNIDDKFINLESMISLDVYTSINKAFDEYLYKELKMYIDPVDIIPYIKSGKLSFEYLKNEYCNTLNIFLYDEPILTIAIFGVFDFYNNSGSLHYKKVWCKNGK